MNIKALMILGSLIGFLTGTGFGILSESPWSAILWRACAGALVAAVLTRWWGGVWVSSLQDSIHQRHAQNQAAAEAKTGGKA